MQRRQIRFNAGPDDVDVLRTVQRGVLLPAWLDVVSGGGLPGWHVLTARCRGLHGVPRGAVWRCHGCGNSQLQWSV